VNSTDNRDPDRQLQFLLALLEDKAFIDGDVLKISEHTWAIHGEIEVEGETLMAEFDTYDEAWYVLEQLRITARRPSDLAE
jgi:hypothetical protein